MAIIHTMKLTICVLHWLSLLSLTQASNHEHHLHNNFDSHHNHYQYRHRHQHRARNLTHRPDPAVQARAAPDAADFGWVRRWAAIGDSFTAGIGAGKLYGPSEGDKQCSRYTHAYPALVNNALGPAVNSFQFRACSGDRSGGIFNQAQQLQGNLDLVMMTAGGNDLCLAAIIMNCIFKPSPFTSEAACNRILDKADDNIRSILKPNLREILIALNSKMKDNSIVVFNGYAQFFNTENEDCSTKQDWSFPKIPYTSGLVQKLTIARRKRFNQLVVDINDAIQDVIADINSGDDIKFKAVYGNWDFWAQEGVRGQFCEPGSTGAVPDKNQPDLIFYKPPTYISPYANIPVLNWFFKRDNGDVVDTQGVVVPGIVNETNIYDSLLWKSANPDTAVRHQLDRRAPAPPNCPGDSGFDWTFGMGLPDTYGKFFHPNEAGHVAIASFALDAMIGARAAVLGVGDPACDAVDEFKCWRKEGRRGYAYVERLHQHFREYCEGVVPPRDTVGWTDVREYDRGTPDEHSFMVRLSSKVSVFKKDECLESMEKLVHGCDGSPENPMNWKSGGRWKRGEYTYEINIKRENRPWPPMRQTTGTCDGSWKALFSSYHMEGAGWSSWDYGQQTLLPALKGCMGLGITNWNFEYYDQPTEDGMEWKAWFNTPVFVNNRCMKNNKVAFQAGGFTDGCGGSGWA